MATLAWNTHCHADPVNAFQQLEIQRQVGDGVGRLIWLGTVSWCLAHGFRSRRCVREETSHARVITMSHPSIRVGIFDKQRRDEKQRVFEQPNAPFNLRLTCVGDDDLGMA